MLDLVLGSPSGSGRTTARKALIFRALETAPSQTLLRGELFERAAAARDFNPFDEDIESFERSFRRTLNGDLGPIRTARFAEQGRRGLPVGILVRLLQISRRLSGYLPSGRASADLAFCVDAHCAVPVMFEQDLPSCVFPPFRLGVGRAPPFLTLRDRLSEDDVHPHCETDIRLFGHLNVGELTAVDPRTFSSRLLPLREAGSLHGVRIALFSELSRSQLVRQGLRQHLP